jgi:hypothetical protein
MILVWFGCGTLAAGYGQFPAGGVFHKGRARRHGHHVEGRLDSP